MTFLFRCTRIALGAALLVFGVDDLGCKPWDGMQSDIRKKKDMKRTPLRLDLTCLKLVRDDFRDPRLADPPKDARAAVVGTGPNCNGTITLDRLATGTFDIRTTVAYDSLVGMDGPFGANANLRVTWPGTNRLRQIQGQLVLGEGDDPDRFEVYVFDEDHLGGNLAEVVLFEDTYELDLRMIQGDDSFTFQARATPFAGLDAREGIPAEWQTIHTTDDALPADAWELALVVGGLGKGGRFFFDGFSLAGPSLGGSPEQGFIDDMQNAVDDLMFLHEFLSMPLDDEDVLADILSDTHALLVAVEEEVCFVFDDVKAASDESALQDTTETKLVLRHLKSTKKKLKMSIAQIEKAMAKQDATPRAKAALLVAKSVDCLCLGITNLGGYKTTKLVQLPLVPLVP